MRGTIATIAAATALTAAGTTEAAAAEAPVYEWTGFYVGAHLGLASVRNKTFGQEVYDGFEGGEGFSGSNSQDFSTRAAHTQFIAGVHAGYNYMMGRILLGIIADSSFIGGGRSWQDFIGANYGSYGYVATRLAALHTVRAKLGLLLMSDLLFYATGGGAFGNADFRFQGSDGLSLHSRLSSGYAFGFGLEKFICPDVSVSTEGLLVDLGSRDISGSASLSSAALRTSSQQYIWTVGLNYHF